MEFKTIEAFVEFLKYIFLDIFHIKLEIKSY